MQCLPGPWILYIAIEEDEIDIQSKLCQVGSGNRHWCRISNGHSCSNRDRTPVASNKPDSADYHFCHHNDTKSNFCRDQSAIERGGKAAAGAGLCQVYPCEQGCASCGCKRKQQRSLPFRKSHDNKLYSADQRDHRRKLCEVR